MINREFVVEELQARYAQELGEAPSVKRLEYPDFIKAYTGILATDTTLSLSAETFEPPESEIVRVVKLRPYLDGVKKCQRIEPQSYSVARSMVEGTERHDEIVRRYLAASTLQRGLMRARHIARISSVMLPIAAGRKIPDIIDYQKQNQEIGLVVQL